MLIRSVGDDEHPAMTFSRRSSGVYWLHLPVAMILAIYLPAALLGLFVFGDSPAYTIVALLGVFVLSYYLACLLAVRTMDFRDGARAYAAFRWNVRWRTLAWGAAFIYLATIVVTCLTAPSVPLFTAVTGGTKFEIAQSRAGFLVNRVGDEALLRYVAVIFGRSILPLLVTYLYFTRDRFRHVALIVLLVAYLLALEKASPIFAFLPLIVMRAVEHDRRATLALATSLIACVGLWTYLAIGSVEVAPQPQSPSTTEIPQNPRASMVAPAGMGRQGDPLRHELLNFVLPDAAYAAIRQTRAAFELSWILNRIVWIPYVTAYDWLRVHEEILKGKLHYGRTIGIVSWLMGKPKLNLERIVYEYQFGSSPYGVGGANTIFFVDAKLAFGWAGVVLYCVVFGLCAAVIYSSQNLVVKVASITSIFTASVSSLTATLLSGGLVFYVVLALLLRDRTDAPKRLDTRQ